MHCFRFIGDRIGDTVKVHTDIVEEIVEHCIWVMGGVSCDNASVRSYSNQSEVVHGGINVHYRRCCGGSGSSNRGETV